jgi:hypothetical protein
MMNFRTPRLDPRSNDERPSPDGRSGRRRRLLIAAIAVSVSWKVLVLGVGGALSRALIDDGLAEVAPENRAYGQQALATARALWSGPLERHGVVRRLHVVRIDRVAADNTDADGDADAARCGGLTARVRAYTFFAIPYSEARTVCDRGTVEYRVLPHRRRAE